MRVHTDWLLTPWRVAIHLPTSTAVVADLHLGYAHARRRRGDAVPLPSLEEQLRGLGDLKARHGITRVVVAGDLFEDAQGHELWPEFVRWLGDHGMDLVSVVPGNHDRHLGLREGEGVAHPEGFVLGEWRVVHGDGPLPRGKVVMGHFHPCVRLGRRIAAPCYLVGEQQIVLPAYSQDAAGGNVLGVPRWRTFRCAVIVGDEVLDLGRPGQVLGPR